MQDEEALLGTEAQTSCEGNFYLSHPQHWLLTVRCSECRSALAPAAVEFLAGTHSPELSAAPSAPGAALRGFGWGGIST